MEKFDLVGETQVCRVALGLEAGEVVGFEVVGEALGVAVGPLVGGRIPHGWRILMSLGNHKFQERHLDKRKERW